MSTIPSFDVPDEALEALDLTPEEFASELRLAASAFWYDRGLISQGIGASIAGLNRRDFILGLSRLEVEVLQETVEDLKKVLERARTARGEQLAPDHSVSGRPD